MLVSKIQPKDVWVTIELPVTELKHLRDVLSHSEIQFDSINEPGMIKSNAYVQDHFFPVLSKIIENIENDEGY